MKNTLTILLMLLFSVVTAAAQTIIVHEVSGGVATPKTVTGPPLTTIRTLPYNGLGNNDFTGQANEYYDVFFSNPAGTQVSASSTSCVTVRGQYSNPVAGQGFNVGRVDLIPTSGIPKYYSSVASFTLGVGGVAGSQAQAVDLLTSTATIFGQASSQKFMHITLCEPKDVPPEANPCCPPINPAVITTQFVYKGLASISDPYTLKFHSPLTPAMAAFNNSMQAYLNYVGSLSLGANKLTVEWRLHDQGTGTVPMTFSTGSSPGNNGPLMETAYTTWTVGGNGIPVIAGNPVFFGAAFGPNQFPLVPNHWYMIHTGTYFEDGVKYFAPECADNDIFVNIRFEAKGAKPVLDIRNIKGETIERKELN